MYRIFIPVLVVTFLASSPLAFAQSSSPNYRVDESAFSSGSGNSSSGNFSAQASAGDLGVGFAYSTNYSAYGGPISPNEEYLELYSATSSVDLDTPSNEPAVLDSDETAFAASTFYVRAYLNSSYSVQVYSDNPTLTSGVGDTITALSTAAAVNTGVEQFGINLKDNATPDIGSEVQLQPDASFANGEAQTGYDTVDQFQFNSGDIIAANGGNPAWGQTNYTISYIANVSDVTEAGLYTLGLVLIATTTF